MMSQLIYEVSDSRKLPRWLSHFLLWLLSSFISSGCTGQSMESIPSSSVVKRPGETLSLSCRGSGFTFSCCTMNWIRQPAGKGLEWIGVGFSSSSRNTYASSVRGRAEISRDDSNSMVYLRLSNLKPEDSAVYYCAKHTHWLKEAEKLYKNSTEHLFPKTYRWQQNIWSQMTLTKESMTVTLNTHTYIHASYENNSWCCGLWLPVSQCYI